MPKLCQPNNAQRAHTLCFGLTSCKTFDILHSERARALRSLLLPAKSDSLPASSLFYSLLLAAAGGLGLLKNPSARGISGSWPAASSAAPGDFSLYFSLIAGRDRLAGDYTLHQVVNCEPSRSLTALLNRARTTGRG